MRAVSLIILIFVVVTAQAKFLQIIQVGDDVKTNDLEHKPRVAVGEPSAPAAVGESSAPAPVRKQSFIYLNNLSCSDAMCAIQCQLSGYHHGKCYGENYCYCWN